MKLLYDTALSLLGKPYVWAGTSPIEGTGFDCSGLVGELLLSGGAHPSPGARLSSQALFDYFSAPSNHCSQDPQLGALVFYGAPSQIHHVAFCMNRKRMLEAGHGGPENKTVEDAIRTNSFVRIRPIRFTPDFIGIFMPDYHCVEL